LMTSNPTSIFCCSHGSVNVCVIEVLYVVHDWKCEELVNAASFAAVLRPDPYSIWPETIVPDGNR